MSSWKASLLAVAALIAIVSLGPSDRQIRAEEQRRVTERLRQQIRTHHGVDARVTCIDTGESRIRCVAAVRDAVLYFQCDRWPTEALCMPANGGAR